MASKDKSALDGVERRSQGGVVIVGAGLAGLFTALGAAVGEAVTPLVRVFIGEEYVLTYRLIVIVGVVACAAFLMSPILVPVGRWCMKVKRTDWNKVEIAKTLD